MAFIAVGGMSSAGHGTDCHDDTCAMSTLAHDPSSHRIGTAAADSSHPLHCVLCHWMRSVRPSTESSHHLARPVVDTVPLHPEVLGVPSAVQAAQPSLRSPPFALLLNA